MRTLRTTLTTFGVVLFGAGAGAGVAAAAGPMIQTTLTPDTPGHGSTLQLAASGFVGSSLPTGLTLSLSGFTTGTTAAGVADSTKALCSAAQESADKCPASSEIGTGTATATAGIVQAPALVHVPLTITAYLGSGKGTHCAATVLLRFSSTNPSFPTEPSLGTLCHTSAGLTASFPKLPAYTTQIPAGYVANLASLSLSLSASAAVKGKRRSYLLNNPKTCGGHWKGALTLTYASGPSTFPLAAACR